MFVSAVMTFSKLRTDKRTLKTCVERGLTFGETLLVRLQPIESH